LQRGREFREATERAMAAPETRVLVMAGEGKNFCVGGDLKAMSASATKRLLDQSLRGLADQLERESGSIAARGDSAEGREGIQAFVAKRPPDFRKAANGYSGASVL
jgi:enoyl-CoA hydratase/carnithine racemase